MKRFKLYSTIIVSLLILLSGYNIYCLTELYKGISAQALELVAQALRDADLDEILNRSKKYPPPDTVPTYKGRQMSQSRSIEGDTLYVTVSDENGKPLEVRKEPLAPGTNYSDIMMNEIGYGAHQTIDPIYPFDIADMDSLFRLSLSRKGIHPRTAYVVRTEPSGRRISAHGLPRDRLHSVTISYDILNGGRYTGYFSYPYEYILSQMTGIILSTIALTVIISIALSYLFRTVSRLRSIEEMKDDFVSNMTHELKTPIAIAYSANDALLHYDTDNDRAKKEKYLMIANKQLKRLGELVENILAMSMERRKAMKLKPESIQLQALAEEIAAAQRARSDKPITINVEVDTDVLIEADRTHLSNVLHNLIDNAVKYSYDSVAIRVTGDRDGFSVSDNGIGIPARSIPYVFNKFYRVPRGDRQEVRGYGIGLYYVKGILHKMGMSISVRSKEGTGTVFTVKFNG